MFSNSFKKYFSFNNIDFLFFIKIKVYKWPFFKKKEYSTKKIGVGEKS